MRSGLVALAIMLGTGATAHAQQVLSAGTIYGGPAQTRAVCYFYNSGGSTLGLSGVQLADQNGNAQPLVVNQCGSNLPAGAACGIAANIAGNQVYSCKAVVS